MDPHDTALPSPGLTPTSLAAPQAATSPTARTVLLVEDQGLVRAGMRSLLQAVAPGIQVMQAADYAEAMAVLAQQPVDIVLLDIDLRSSQSGMDVLAAIRDQDLPVKVIMLSGSDDRETVMACVAAGASGYIAKSADSETVFTQALETVLHDGVFLPASIVHGRGPGASRPPTRLEEHGLSPRMLEVLYYLCQGMPNKSIARQMGITEGTVRKTYVSELLRHFKVTRRTELIIEISRQGLRIPKPLTTSHPEL